MQNEFTFDELLYIAIFELGWDIPHTEWQVATIEKAEKFGLIEFPKLSDEDFERMKNKCLERIKNAR